MRLALYARCSTTEQNVDSQLDALRSYASARQADVVGEYIDHGISGAKSRRPALDEMMRKAQGRAFDAVVCVKLDRLARSVRHLTSVAAELEAFGVDLVVLDQAIDTSSPSGRLLFNVLGSIAEFERDLIRERTRAGLQAAKKRGKRLGRPTVQVPLSDARERLRSGESLRSIASDLGCSRATLQRRLKNVVDSEPLST